MYSAQDVWSGVIVDIPSLIHFWWTPLNMDPKFIEYLLEMGITLNEFMAATIGDKGPILIAYESSKKGNLFQHIC